METRSGTEPSNEPVATNDNISPIMREGTSGFPTGALARIYRPSRSVTTSSRKVEGWRLVFEPVSPPHIDPLMGYTGSKDTLQQIELRFSTKEAAIRYAERQGLAYTVCHATKGNSKEVQPTMRLIRNFTNDALERLGLSILRENYGRAIEDAANHNDPDSAGSGWTDPLEVVHDQSLSQDKKRSILMNWAWNEYLVDQATNEGMPENGRPSRLADVEHALLVLEQQGPSPLFRPANRQKVA